VSKEKDTQQTQVDSKANQEAINLLNATRSVKEIAPRSARAGNGRSLYWRQEAKLTTLRFIAMHAFARAFVHGEGTVALDEFMPLALRHDYVMPNVKQAFEHHDVAVATAATISLVDILGGSGQSAGDKANPPRLEGLLWSWSIKKDPDGFPISLVLKHAPDPSEPVWPGILAPLWGSVDKITSFRIATDPRFRMEWIDRHSKLVEEAVAKVATLIERERAR